VQPLGTWLSPSESCYPLSLPPQSVLAWYPSIIPTLTDASHSDSWGHGKRQNLSLPCPRIHTVRSSTHAYQGPPTCLRSFKSPSESLRLPSSRSVYTRIDLDLTASHCHPPSIPDCHELLLKTASRFPTTTSTLSTLMKFAGVEFWTSTVDFVSHEIPLVSLLPSSAAARQKFIING
jgi:hypothetical protein